MGLDIHNKVHGFMGYDIHNQVLGFIELDIQVILSQVDIIINLWSSLGIKTLLNIIRCRPCIHSCLPFNIRKIY